MEKKEYKPYLRVSNDDFLAASSLGNNVIGILFDKNGGQIKIAIQARLDLIVGKIIEYRSTIQKIEEFIDAKRLILKDLDKFYNDKRDEREAVIIPYKREVEKIVQDCNNTLFDFDKKVFEEVSKRAVIIEKDVDKMNFTIIDDLLRKEEATIAELRESARSGEGYSGQSGYSGGSGLAGYQGVHETICTTQEDKAFSKINTIRNLLQKYGNKIQLIKKIINVLLTEQRWLQLIYNNIEDERSYKLDLNKLSALGFEDVQKEDIVIVREQ